MDPSAAVSIWLRTAEPGSQYTSVEVQSLHLSIDSFKRTPSAQDVLEAKPGRVRLFHVLHAGPSPTVAEEEHALQGRPLDPTRSFADEGVCHRSFLLASVSSLSPRGVWAVHAHS